MTPDKCPKCGAAEYIDRTSSVEYVCGSVRMKGQDSVRDLKPACRHISALRERVKRLEEAGDYWIPRDSDAQEAWAKAK